MPALVPPVSTSIPLIISSFLLTFSFLTLTTLTSAAFVPMLPQLERSDVCPVVFPTSSPDNRVVGGDKGDPFIRSHLISFHREGCGGSLLSKRWGLTAGHCNVHEGSSPTIAGTSSNNGVKLPLKKVYKHPDYYFPKNDVVLLEFAEDAPEDANFVYINDNDAIPAVGEYCRVAGWGHTDENDNPNKGNLLYQVDLPVISTESCAKTVSPMSSELEGQINKKMHICAGYDRGRCDSCKADSGGPLVVYSEDGKLVQVALVSFGVGCAREGVPGGYTRVSSYVDWMKSVGAVFETRSARKPVFLKEVSSATPSDGPSSSDPEAPSPAPVAPTSPPEQPGGTTAPPDTKPSTEGSGGSATTAPPTTGIGPASPPINEPGPDGGSDSDGGSDPGGSIDPDPDAPDGAGPTVPGGQEPSATGPPAPSTPGSVGDVNPEVTIEGDPTASSGPDVSGNSGAAFAGGPEDGGGVNVGVVVGSCLGVLAIVGVICMIVILRRRAAARSRAAGTSDSSDVPPTSPSEAIGSDTVGTDSAAAAV